MMEMQNLLPEVKLQWEASQLLLIPKLAILALESCSVWTDCLQQMLCTTPDLPAHSTTINLHG